MNDLITIKGGKTITIQLEPAATGMPPLAQEIKVRQVPVREYDAGFAVVNDEFALAAFVCGQKKEWAFTLTPESFEAVLETGREVNEKGFFSFCQRRTELLQRQNADMFGQMKDLPPEALKVLVELGEQRTHGSASRSSLPGWPPPPAG